MKKKWPLIFCIVIPICVVLVFCIGFFVLLAWDHEHSYEAETLRETSASKTIPSETSPSKTTSAEINTVEPNESKPSARSEGAEDVRKEIAQNKSKIIAGNTAGFDSESLEYLAHVDKRFGMHYFAPEGMWIMPKRKYSDYYSKVAASYMEPFFEDSNVEFVCTSKDGNRSLFMIVNKLKDPSKSLDQLLNSHGNRNIGGKNFIDASNGGWRIYCRQVGAYVITIPTTSDSLLAGFTS